MLNVILATLGSSGDVHPFIGIGVELKRRGHQVTLISTGNFGPQAAQAGLSFVPCSSAEDYEMAIDVLDAGDKARPMEAVTRVFGKAILATFESIASLNQPGNTVLAASPLCLGAKLAHEKLGIPLASVLVEVMLLRSVYETPLYHENQLRIPWANRFLTRLGYWLFDRLIIARYVLPEINAIRGELGLLPIQSNRIQESLLSGQRIIGLWPDWFGSKQPDWPSQTELTGFIFHDRDDTIPERNLSEWLGEFAEAPILFTPGSWCKKVDYFFRAAAEACALLGRPGVLLTRYAQQIPKNLPPMVRHSAYLPFSSVLPRAAALVHHGGIGTAAQALLAGTRQLVVPMAVDQFDNAERLSRLGVSMTLSRKRLDGPALARTLDRLLKSNEMAENCLRWSGAQDPAASLKRACDLIEQLRPAAPSVQSGRLENATKNLREPLTL